MSHSNQLDQRYLPSFARAFIGFVTSTTAVAATMLLFAAI
jgi:hypothetical protein